MNIGRIRVTIDPFTYAYPVREKSSAILREIRIGVEADGQEYAFTEAVKEDDLTSRFDYIMERAGREVKRLMREAEEKREEAPE